MQIFIKADISGGPLLAVFIVGGQSGCVENTIISNYIFNEFNIFPFFFRTSVV